MTSKRTIASRVDSLRIALLHSALAKTASANSIRFCSYKKRVGGLEPACQQTLSNANFTKLR